MSNYQQMREAAKSARKNYLDYQERVWGYYAAILKGLIQGCGVPQEHIVYMKWNGLEGYDGKFSRGDGSMVYSLPGAVSYDSRDNSFNLGILIYLTPANESPRQHVRFLLWINEKDGVPSIRTGFDAKPKLVPLKDEIARNAYCDEIGQMIVEAFSLPQTQNPKPIGFDIGPLSSET